MPKQDLLSFYKALLSERGLNPPPVSVTYINYYFNFAPDTVIPGAKSKISKETAIPPVKKEAQTDS